MVISNLYFYKKQVINSLVNSGSALVKITFCKIKRGNNEKTWLTGK